MINEENKDKKFINSSEKKKLFHPDAPEVLEDDLASSDEVSGDGVQVKSSDPSSQEWGAREDVSEEQRDNKSTHH